VLVVVYLLGILFPPHVPNEPRVLLLSTRNCATTFSGDCQYFATPSPPHSVIVYWRVLRVNFGKYDGEFCPLVLSPSPRRPQLPSVVFGSHGELPPGEILYTVSLLISMREHLDYNDAHLDSLCMQELEGDLLTTGSPGRSPIGYRTNLTLAYALRRKHVQYITPIIPAVEMLSLAPGCVSLISIHGFVDSRGTVDQHFLFGLVNLISVIAL
jgi:hypothetical protein